MSSGGRREGAGRKSKFGEKTVVLRIPESMLEIVQIHLKSLHNQNDIVTNSLDNVQNQKIVSIQAIVSKYEANANDSPRWVQAKKLIADLKKALS